MMSRAKRSLPDRSHRVRWAVIALAVILGAALIGYRFGGSPTPRRSAPDEWSSTGSGKVFGQMSPSPSLILIGDSYAAMWGSALDEHARGTGKSGLILSREGCPFLLGAGASADSACLEANRERMARVMGSSAPAVVIANAWPHLIAKPSAYRFALGTLKADLIETVRQLQQAKKAVTLILHGEGPPESSVGELFLEVSAETGVQWFDTAWALCPDGVCKTELDGKPYFDGPHLTLEGSRAAVSLFDPVMLR